MRWDIVVSQQAKWRWNRNGQLQTYSSSHLSMAAPDWRSGGWCCQDQWDRLSCAHTNTWAEFPPRDEWRARRWPGCGRTTARANGAGQRVSLLNSTCSASHAVRPDHAACAMGAGHITSLSGQHNWVCQLPCAKQAHEQSRSRQRAAHPAALALFPVQVFRWMMSRATDRCRVTASRAMGGVP